MAAHESAKRADHAALNDLDAARAAYAAENRRLMALAKAAKPARKRVR